MPFIGTDPVDIGQVVHYSWLQLLTAPHSASYYRPLTMLALKALLLGQTTFQPWVFHLSLYIPHLLCTALAYRITHTLTRNSRTAIITALLFACYPLNVQTLAVGHTPYPWQTLLTFSAIYFHLKGEQAPRWRMFAWGCVLLGQFIHENGILIAPLLMWTVLWQDPTRLRQGKFWRTAALYSLPTIIYLLLWTQMVPQSGAGVLPPEWGIPPDRIAYLSQGLSMPFAAFTAHLPYPTVERLTPNFAQSWLALIGTALLALAITRRSATNPHFHALPFALGWFVGALSLALLTRGYAYLELAPRLFYFAALGACLFWAHLAAQTKHWQIATLALLGISLWIHTRSLHTYWQGGQIIHQLTDLQAEYTPDQHLLFINFPDRIETKTRLLPVGYWGVVVAPVSVDLSAYAQLIRGSAPTSTSLSDFLLSAAPLQASPSIVFTRGENQSGSQQLFGEIRTSQAVVVSEYLPTGGVELRQVGNLSTGTASVPIGQVGTHLQVYAARVQSDPTCQCVNLALNWQVLSPLGEELGWFAHLIAPDGSLAGQADGWAFGNTYPPQSWQVGEIFHDLRRIPLPSPLQNGTYTVKMGLYNRQSQERLPVTLPDGTRVTDGALPVGEWASGR
jgi:hypothetical protein